ncbi:MAG: hypothetical protein KatS3mg111_0784 [Pirellulaceae bacterium]|nr:MAG: hypothetical protein KatS3mg111_0784 [Pirellulaceae bacterium]
MQFSDELLIEYLLGETPRELGELIEQCARHDTSLQERLATLRFALGQVDTAPVFEPPGDLVDLTMARIGCPANEHSSACASETRDHAPVRQQALLPGAHPDWERSARGGRIWDSTFLVMSLSALCCLLLPVMLRVRFDARRWQCAENLRVVGRQLFDYAVSHPRGRMPEVFIEGPFDFAGIYAVHLKSSGRQITPFHLQCPGSVGPADQLCTRGKVPSFTELRTLSVAEIDHWAKVVGGDYAYSLGVMERGEIVPAKYCGREYYAVLADAPLFQGPRELYSAHGGVGINVLYEDGRVRFLPVKQTVAAEWLHDHPFRNHLGEHRVGITQEDAALGPSDFSPLGNSAAEISCAELP